MVLPLEARMQAAFHLAYCVSCNQMEETEGDDGCSDKKGGFFYAPDAGDLTLSHFM